MMIPISFVWDSRKRSVYIKWNGFFSFGLEKGKVLKKMFGITVPIPGGTASGKIHSPALRWVYLKEALSFLKEWELRKVEGSLSFPDPMVNGLLYGWLSAIETGKVGHKINMSINFAGENWCSGEATVPPKVLFYHLRRWIFPLLKGIRGRAEKHH